MYKINTITLAGNTSTNIFRIPTLTFIPVNVENSDYIQFKKDIAHGAELQDANGNVMTQAEVQTFLGTLP